MHLCNLCTPEAFQYTKRILVSQTNIKEQWECWAQSDSQWPQDCLLDPTLQGSRVTLGIFCRTKSPKNHGIVVVYSFSLVWVSCFFWNQVTVWGKNGIQNKNDQHQHCLIRNLHGLSQSVSELIRPLPCRVSLLIGNGTKNSTKKMAEKGVVTCT